MSTNLGSRTINTSKNIGPLDPTGSSLTSLADALAESKASKYINASCTIKILNTLNCVSKNQKSYQLCLITDGKTYKVAYNFNEDFELEKDSYYHADLSGNRKSYFSELLTIARSTKEVSEEDLSTVQFTLEVPEITESKEYSAFVVPCLYLEILSLENYVKADPLGNILNPLKTSSATEIDIETLLAPEPASTPLDLEKDIVIQLKDAQSNIYKLMLWANNQDDASKCLKQSLYQGSTFSFKNYACTKNKKGNISLSSNKFSEVTAL